MNQSPAHQAALATLQAAVHALLGQPHATQNNISKQAQNLFKWPNSPQFQPLKVLFDRIDLGQHHQNQQYWPIPTIQTIPTIQAENKTCPPIPYPTTTKPTNLETWLQNIRNEIDLSPEDWENLPLLTLIVEKYGSLISLTDPDTAFTDLVRSTAAVAAALAENPNSEELTLIGGDLSGIQNFIYTIASDGALKSLRARSFYLELVTEEVVQQLLNALNLPRTSIIYAGGGNLYLLAPQKTDQLSQKIKQVQEKFNAWLFKDFQGKVFLALDSIDITISALTSKELSQKWKEIPKKLIIQKQQKFKDILNNLLEVKDSFNPPCQVCHRDDVKTLNPLSEDSETLACSTCCSMYKLGDYLFKVETIVRSTQKKPDAEIKTPPLVFDFQDQKIYYYPSLVERLITQEVDSVLLVNSWDIKQYRFRKYKNPVSLFLGQYGQESAEKSGTTMQAQEFTAKSQGIPRVGYLRMDVDNLGKIFAQGLGEYCNLPRLAGLSRMMTYFFKVYLNSLAENRAANTVGFEKLTEEDKRLNLLFIYAGGDDLFIVGAWDEVVAFGFDVYQSFRAYTGKNPDITLSGGVSLATAKFPLYQAASESGDMEEQAKGNGRDSFGLFGQAFKWDEWLGNPQIIENLKVGETQKLNDYLQGTKPPLFGILPLVQELNQLNVENQLSRAFIRNLLDTARLQDLKIQDIERTKKQHDRPEDIRYYLHLPKIAYTIARLPKSLNLDLSQSL
ncbi:MAG: type III-A CRISPR-associated protein Cas10/Csm1, partial [Spirulina sp. DLM2.Bin59]